MSTANLPPNLKPISPILARANELEPKQPLIAYYLRTYAAQKGIDLMTQAGKDEATTMYLLTLMDRLEKDKATLNPDTEQGRAILELFALKLFKKADDDDRAANHSQSTVKLFYTASILMEATKQFGEMSEDIQDKYKYARWKAAEISRAFKMGIAPQAGPYGAPTEEGEANEDQTSSGLRPIAPADMKMDSGFSSTSTTTTDNDLPPPPIFSYPTTTNDTLSSFSTINKPPSPMDVSSFYGLPPPPSDYASSTSASSSSSINSASPTNNITTFNNMPFNAPSNQSTTTTTTKNINSFAAARQSAGSTTSSFTSLSPKPSSTTPPTPPPQTTTTTTSAIKPSPAAARLAAMSSPSSSSPSSSTSSALKKAPSIDAIMDAQKQAKFAVSALQFSDVDTAVKHLRAALEMLGGL